MATQTITIIDPPQPEGQGEYSIDRLTPSFIREYQNNADYTTKTGNPAPAYNPALPIKRWADASVKAGAFQILTYNTIHLDPSAQNPIVTQIAVPGFLASTVNMPPDSGPQPPSAGEFLVPKRTLLPNEQLWAWPFGISVRNTDIYKVPAAPSTGGGGFTDQDRATLNAIAAIMGVK